LNHLSPDSDAVAHDDLPFLGMMNANLLLNGVDSANRERIESSLVRPRRPITRWQPGEPLVLPSSAAAGTLILQDVGLMPHDDQLRLMTWLEHAAGRTRVVCTTSASLYDYVEAGAFSEALYYRLNILLVDVG
jgi:transcriptional regulator of acetoin/glycerol metabolism